MDANSMHEGVALRAGEVLPGAAAHDEQYRAANHKRARRQAKR